MVLVVSELGLLVDLRGVPEKEFLFLHFDLFTKKNIGINLGLFAFDRYLFSVHPSTFISLLTRFRVEISHRGRVEVLSVDWVGGGTVVGPE